MSIVGNALTVGGGGPKLLWTNPSPTASFGEKTISVNLAAYQGVLIKFRKNDTVSYYIYVPKITITTDNCPAVVSPGDKFWRPSSAQVRLVTAISDSGITFARGRWVSDDTASDTVLKPLEIYGVKWEL
ncbi:MAG: hypothetical protein IJJ88_05865 [Oscillospiraceae bacterium]|nr:hypothetical protein [Oscillospiraceae bacterium]